MEGEKKFITTADEGSPEALKIKNELQVNLIKKSGLHPVEWIEKYSAKFGTAFHNLLVKDAQFLKHHLETPEATLDILEQAIYEGGEIIEEVLEEAA